MRSENLSRRRLMAAGLSAGMLAALPARAQQQPAPQAAPAEKPAWVMPSEWQPRIVNLSGNLPAGEIHVDPNVFALYFTLPEGKAIRYAVGVGKGDLYEPGSFWVGAKKEWPSWKPTAEMVQRNPAAYGKWKDAAMPGGPTNPLGARALYLYDVPRGDTMLRIHGTPQPWTIGTAVSNGCVRLVNEHITHLYDQVGLQARAVLYPKTRPVA